VADVREVVLTDRGDTMTRVMKIIAWMLFVNAVLLSASVIRSFVVQGDVKDINRSTDKVELQVHKLDDQVNSLDKFARDLAKPNPDAIKSEELRSVFEAVFDIRRTVCADNPNPACDDVATGVIMTQLQDGG
jgi:cell division protein FtsL